jgi:hypothetical protein
MKPCDNCSSICYYLWSQSEFHVKNVNIDYCFLHKPFFFLLVVSPLFYIVHLAQNEATIIVYMCHAAVSCRGACLDYTSHYHQVNTDPVV